MARTISFESRGNFDNTERFLRKPHGAEIKKILDSLGKQGVAALVGATPVDSGITASSWGYEVISSRGEWSIAWTNSEVVAGTPLVILLQYGHGTGTGGYVQGRDFINPAIVPIFDKISETAWKVVTSA